MTEVNHRCPNCLTIYTVDRQRPEPCPECSKEIIAGDINYGAIVTGPASYSEDDDDE